MADFLRMKYENPKMKQSGIANQLGYSSSTLQRYRNDIDMLSPYRIQSSNTDKRTKNSSISNSDNNSHPDFEVERPQMTANDLKTNTKSNEKDKNNLIAGFVHDIVEITDQ